MYLRNRVREYLVWRVLDREVDWFVLRHDRYERLVLNSAGNFASEVFPISEETRSSDEFRSVFRHVSLVFGTFFLVFAAIQLLVLLAVGIDAFVAVRVLDAIGILGLIVYSVRYAVDHLGSSMQLAS